MFTAQITDLKSQIAEINARLVRYEEVQSEFGVVAELISCTYRINSEKADKKYKNETLEAVLGLIAT